MKRYLTIITFSLLGTFVFAQQATESPAIFVGLMGHAGWHPGIKAGASFNLKSWDEEVSGQSRQSYIFASPQLGAYVYPNVQTGYLAVSDFGYKRHHRSKPFYNAVSLGFGGLVQSQVTGTTVNLGDGSEEKVRANWAWLLATMNYEFGKAINENVGWYGKGTYGFKISSARGNSALFFVEFGLRFKVF